MAALKAFERAYGTLKARMDAGAATSAEASAQAPVKRPNATPATKPSATPATKPATTPSMMPVLLMVSGGSDSTALAYWAKDAQMRGLLGPVAIFHFNHQLRGNDSDGDERFVRALAEALDFPFFGATKDIAAISEQSGENLEAAARHERYRAALEALERFCAQQDVPLASARIFTAHTADDRLENFFMRSIVGTGPGGFRSMAYEQGILFRPFLDCTRQELRGAIENLAAQSAIAEDETMQSAETENVDVEDKTAQNLAPLPIIRDAEGNLWREDTSNEETERLRAYVRHEIIPRAQARNPRLHETLIRTMNLIGDEDDYLDGLANTLLQDCTRNLNGDPLGAKAEGFILLPEFGKAVLPLQRRAVHRALKYLLGEEERIDTASVEKVLAAFAEKRPLSGYTNNIQGNLAVSANKRGVRVEPMVLYRKRRKSSRQEGQAKETSQLRGKDQSRGDQ